MIKKLFLTVCVILFTCLFTMAETWSKELEKKAKNGDIASQLAVGDAYFSGNGVDVDKAKAAKWYYKAVEGKSEEAKDRLYKFYSKELEQLAKKGDTQALFELGKDYYEGDGVEKNANKAAKYLKKAMKNGHEDAAKLFYSFDSNERRYSELKFKIKGGYTFSGYKDVESPFVLYLGNDTIRGILKSPIEFRKYDAYLTDKTFSFNAAIDCRIVEDGKLFTISDKAAKISGVVYKTDKNYVYDLRGSFLSIDFTGNPTMKAYVFGNEVEMESFSASLAQRGDGAPLGFSLLEYISPKILYTSTDMQKLDPKGYLNSVPAKIKENMKVWVKEFRTIKGGVEYQSQFEFTNGGILVMSNYWYAYSDDNYVIEIKNEYSKISLKGLKKTFNDGTKFTYTYSRIHFTDGSEIEPRNYYKYYMPAHYSQNENDENNAFKTLLSFIGSDDKDKITKYFLAPIATPEQEEKISKYVVSQKYKSLEDFLHSYYIGELIKDGKSELLYVYNGNTFTLDRIRELDKKVKFLKDKNTLAENKKEFNRLAAKYGSAYASSIYDYKSGYYKLNLKKGMPLALLKEIWILNFHASYDGNVSVYYLYQEKTYYKLWFTNGRLTSWSQYKNY